MLTEIREKISGPVAWVFLAVIGASFVFVGVGFNAAILGSNSVATVNGEEISVGYFENEYRNFIAENPQYADVGDSLRAQIRSQLLNRTIREVLIDEYLDDKGFAISDERLMEIIRQIPEFQVDGEFDMETYRVFLGQQGLDPARFERIQRQRIREQQLNLAIGATALVTPSEYRRYLNIIAEQRVVTTAELSPELVADEVTVSEEEITAFYDENATLYQRPESADIEYILVSRNAIADAVEVTEAELQAFYEQEQGRYLQDEQRQARHILIPFDDDKAAAEEQATALLARVNAGEPFADLARQYSADGGTAANGGDLGVLTRTQLPGELGAAIFSMDEGEIAGPVETEFGFHVIRLDEIVEPGPLPLEQVRGDLLAELQEDEADGAFRAVERRLSDALFDNPEMTAIAEATDLPVQTLEGFTRQGGGPFGSNQVAIDTVFDSRVLLDGEISNVVELDADRSALFKVTQYNEATRLPLSEVRAQVEATLRAQKTQALLDERAAAIVAAVEAGTPFADAAAEAGATVNEPAMLSRDDSETDPSLLFSVFSAPKPSADDPTVDSVQSQAGSVVVFQLEAVMPGRPESIPLDERDQGKLLLAQRSGFSDYSAFVDALVENADIKIDSEIVEGDTLLQ